MVVQINPIFIKFELVGGNSTQLFLECFCLPFWWFAFVLFTVLVNCVCKIPPQALLLCFRDQAFKGPDELSPRHFSQA